MSPIKRLSGLVYQANNLKQAVGILFVTVLISNVLGLLRNVIIANRVGLTYGSIGPLDHYYAAFVLPDLLYSIIIVGALSSAVLPTLAKIDAEDDQQKFWQTFNTILSTGFVVIVLGLMVLYFVLPYLMPFLFPGFNHADIASTTALAQVLLLSPLFFTVSQLSTSALQAKKYFFAPALAPIVYNLAIIAGAMLIPDFGLPVLVIGVILGAISHFLVQLPTLLRLGWRFQFKPGFNDQPIRHIIRLMVPRAIALTSNQLLLIAFYYLASHFRDGSIAIYRLTDDLQTAPVLLLANTLAMAVLPDFVRHVAKENRQEFQELVGKSIRFIIYLFLPITAFLLIFREPIIDLYISIGHSIDASEIQLATQTFSFFVASLLFQGSVLLLARAYFAHHDTLRPTIYSIISIGFSFALAVILTKTTDLQVVGLALAFSAGYCLNAVLLWSNIGLPNSVLFRDSQGRLNFPAVLGGSLITAVVFIIFRQFAPVLESLLVLSRSGLNFVEILIGFGLGLAFYISWSKAFNLEQWNLIKPTKISTPK